MEAAGLGEQAPGRLGAGSQEQQQRHAAGSHAVRMSSFPLSPALG